MKLPAVEEKPRAENTIALINIVFLMLIFFLIAGTLAPPMEGEIELVRAADARAVQPPRGLFITETGILKYEGKTVSPEAFVGEMSLRSDNRSNTAQEALNHNAQTAPADGPIVRLVSDKRLPAVQLIDVIDRLKTAGAGRIVLITERKQP